MVRTPKTSPSPSVALLIALTLAAILAACGGGSGGSDGGSANPGKTSSTPKAGSSGSKTVVPNVSKSCKVIAGSGSVQDVSKVFDKYKGNSNAFTPADAKAMRDALDRLAKAGDNATPKIREAVVLLVADAGSMIDSRAKLEGVGKVASVQDIQKEIDTLCR